MKRFLMILVAAVVAVGMGFATEVPTVVIAPFTAGPGVEQGEVDIVQKMFAAQYGNTGKAQVVDRSRFNLIQEQLNFQSSDWSNSEKVADFGRALNASQVVTGEFLKLSKGVFVNIQVFDVNTTIIIASISPALIVSDIYDVIDRMPEICEELASKAIGETVEKKISTTSKDKTAVKKNENLDAVPTEDKFVPRYKIGGIGPGGGIVFKIQGDLAYECSGPIGIADWNTGKQICKNYHAGGYYDWYMPEPDEVRELFKLNIKEIINWRGLVWTSEPEADGKAYGIKFNEKDYTNYITSRSGKGVIVAIRFFLNGNSNLKYNIGDMGPGGGIVFYASEEPFYMFDGKNGVRKCNYLEVTKDIIGHASWCPNSDFEFPHENFSLYDSGEFITYAIVTAHPDANKNTCAAYACYMYTTDTTSVGDWYLPTSADIYKICKNLGNRILTNTSDGWHWVANSNDSSTATAVELNDFVRKHTIGYHSRSRTHAVRAVHAF